MNYAASRDYQDFNNVTFYTGDLQGAYNQKYEFPDEFQKVENGKVTGSVTRSDILSGLNYNVVICSEEMDIESSGQDPLRYDGCSCHRKKDGNQHFRRARKGSRIRDGDSIGK